MSGGRTESSRFIHVGIGTSPIQPLDIAIDKAMAIHGEVFIRCHNEEKEIVDPSRILNNPFRFDDVPYMNMEVDIQKEISIMKSVQCGKTESIFNRFKMFYPEKIKAKFENRDYVNKSVNQYIYKQES